MSNGVRVLAEVDQYTPVTISLRMPLSHWKTAMKKMKENPSCYESDQIIQAIRVAVDRIESVLVMPTEFDDYGNPQK